MLPDPRRRVCSYELDSLLVIRNVGSDWDQFAIENGAPELVSPNPLGRPLWMFLTDATTLHLYELLFERVSATRRPITIPVRCDGAAKRRYMSLTIAPRSAGYSISSILVRSEPRLPILLFDRTAPRRAEAVLVCSWCQRLNVKGRWLEAEDAVTALQVFERDDPPRLDHSVCEACERFMVTMLRDDSLLPPSR